MLKHELCYPRTIGVATDDLSKNYLDCWTLGNADRSLRRTCAIANFVNFSQRLQRCKLFATLAKISLHDYYKNHIQVV